MPDRKQAPVIVDAVDFDLRLKHAEKIVLNNGVEVYAVNAGAEEVISLGSNSICIVWLIIYRIF